MLTNSLLLFVVLCASCSTLGDNAQRNPSQSMEVFQGQSLQDYLARFDALEKKHPGPIPSSVQITSGSGPHLVIGCMVHGDETGCLPPVLEVIDGIESKKFLFSGTFSVFIGNRKAGEAGKRFLEQDLNRVFLDEAPSSVEKNRAKEIMPLIKTADLFVDLHQTIEPTDQAFYTFGFSELQYSWAKYLEGASVLITRPANMIFAAGSLSATEYGTNQGVPTITLESSQKGFSKVAYERDLLIILKAMKGLKEVGQSRDLVSVKKIAKNSKDLVLLKRVANQPFNDPKIRLTPGFRNFSKVSQGEVIGINGDGSVLKAPADGYLLFPKYPSRNARGEALKPLPSDLFLLQQEATIEEWQR